MEFEISNCSLAVRAVSETRVVPHPEARHRKRWRRASTAHLPETLQRGGFLISVPNGFPLTVCAMSLQDVKTHERRECSDSTMSVKARRGEEESL
jgi:hypothetical protein